MPCYLHKVPNNISNFATLKHNNKRFPDCLSEQKNEKEVKILSRNGQKLGAGDLFKIDKKWYNIFEKIERQMPIYK